jgi:GNAT superfamily N-acetyltransferase
MQTRIAMRTRYRPRVLEIAEADVASDELLAALRRLVPQLSGTAAPLDAEELRRIVSSPASHLLVAHDRAGEIVGTLTLALFPIPTGVRAWIEAVVVDESARGQGVGQALVRDALERARQAGHERST